MAMTEFNFTKKIDAGLLICAGGFEDRSIAFAKKIKDNGSFEKILILRYESQKEDNEPNFHRLSSLLTKKNKKRPEEMPISADTPVISCRNINSQIEILEPQISKKSVIIDISGMTHLWAICTIHACITNGFKVSIIYSEARWYYPPKHEQKKIVNAWMDRQYDIAAIYLQSAGLKTIHILPEFSGNFRPSQQTCLIIFVGYEPNRIEGLIDSYAPGALIIFYGRSPHEKLWWRTQFSKDLHKELFQKWYTREEEISTLEVDKTLLKLEDEFKIIKDQYDIALAPQCSKMQGIASYIFWRKHPEVQLILTSPVNFNPKRYSHGTGKTFIYEIS